MNHELILLPPLHEPDKRDAAIEALLVEFGIDFAFDEDYNLPNRLPEEMTGVKAVTFDDDSRNDYLNGPMGDKLRAFAEAGGVVAKISGNDNQNPIDENRTRGNIDMLIASANLTMDHPRLRQRLQARPFQQLLDELQEGYLARQIDGGLTKGLDTVFNEPYAYNILHLMEVLHEVEPDCGWHDRLRNVLDQILQMCEPDLHSLDRTSGLSVFFRMSDATGDPKYRDLATKILRRVLDSYPKINGVCVLKPMRDQDLWNECLAHLPPACVAQGDDDLVELATDTARTLYELNFDAELSLWRHWSRPDSAVQGPAVWARGQAWALTGLVGILHHLPQSHPDHGWLCDRIDEIVIGLQRTQTDEGLWHNVMTHTDSRVAARASAMFIYCLADAKRHCWTSADGLDELLHRAWRGVRGRIWRDKLCSVCCGTGAGATMNHYLQRPMLFYGASSVLRAGAHYILAYGDESHCDNPGTPEMTTIR